VVFLFPTAKCTIEATAERTLPTGLDKPRIVSRQPLKRIPKLLAIFIRSDGSRRRTARSVAGSAGLGFPLDELELIHELRIADNRIDRGDGEILML
jgi:hypothetical protein